MRGLRSFLAVSLAIAITGTPCAAKEALVCSDFEDAAADFLKGIVHTSSPQHIRGDERNLSIGWETRARTVLHELAGDDIHAFFGFAPDIKVVHTELPNAYAESPNKLFISSGLLNFVQTHSEYAFILAHEAAHVVLGHVDSHGHHGPPADIAQSIQNEIAADKFAITLLSEAGFSATDAVNLLHRLGQMEQGSTIGIAALNPSISYRIDAIERTFAALLGRATNVSFS